jgi:hypothetical protein
MGNGPAGKRNGHATGGVGGDDDDDIHFEEDFGDPPQGAEFLDRARFILNRWLTLDLPPPDFLLGDLLHVTSRMLLVGATGIGKTNFVLALSMAVASGSDFLHWRGRRPARVLYIDGESSARLLHSRLKDTVRRQGDVVPKNFFILNRESVPDLPPLNTVDGQRFVDYVIQLIGGVDLVIFDNIQSLMIGDMKEEDGWADILPWVRDLTRRAIGQIWIHHTGHDETRSYGTKTREWQLDTVMMLERVNAEQRNDENDIAFAINFPKARERSPANREDFAAAVITLKGEQWVSDRQGARRRGRCTPGARAFRDALVNVLAKEVAKSRSESGYRPSVTENQWRDECISRGLLDPAKPSREQSLFYKYRRELSTAGLIICNAGIVWVDA